MSFQTTTDDQSLSFEDSSLVYVRDRHGVLSSPPGYEKSHLKSVFKFRECDIVYGATCIETQCDNDLSLLQQSPCCLYKICKNFVAKNIHLLDSLQNFPETIGHELFLEALKLQTFHKNSDYLKIFCEAYNGLILKHLCLRQATTLIDEYLEYFQCFNSLTKLDLSHCRLGSKHIYLNFIGKMKSLECLYLKDNCLTDSGLASWSLPHRMLNTGPEFLQILDLSSNPSLTDSCLKSLFKFAHLRSLNLSGSGITFTRGISRIKKEMNFELVSYMEEFSKEMSTTNGGWAAPFISELSLKVHKKRSKTDIVPWTSTGNFYQRLSLATCSAVNMSEKINDNIYPVMLLQSVEHVVSGTRCIQQESKRIESREKRGLVVGDELTTFKRQKLSNMHVQDENLDELDDANLLDSYLKYL